MKRILVIQDLSVMGECSQGITIPVLSALGLESVLLPFSVHPGFCLSDGDICFNGVNREGYLYTDLSGVLASYGNLFMENLIHFDGFFVDACNANEEQVKRICDFTDICFAQDCLVVARSGDFCNSEFYKRANVLFFSVNQAFCVLGYDKSLCGDKETVECCIRRLGELFSATVIITDFYINSEKSSIISFENNTGCLKWYYHKNFNNLLAGTGNLFSAVVSGELFNFSSIEKAVNTGIRFVERSVENTLSKPDHSWYGTDFECVLGDLLNDNSI